MSASTASIARLDRRVLWAYGLPGLVTAIPTIPVFTLLPTFYAEQVGLGLAVTGVALFASRALDVVTDPLVGALSDRRGQPFRQRLLLVGALIAAPALVMLLTPPHGAGALWLFAWSALLYLAWTLIR